MDQLIHLGNILIFASFSVADILWLRLLQIVASAAFIGYFAALDLAAPIAWNVAFIALNLIHSVRLIRARRPAPLTAAQERLYLRVFQSLTRREFLALLGRGEWRDVEVGERLDAALVGVDPAAALEALAVAAVERAEHLPAARLALHLQADRRPRDLAEGEELAGELLRDPADLEGELVPGRPVVIVGEAGEERRDQARVRLAEDVHPGQRALELARGRRGRRDDHVDHRSGRHHLRWDQPDLRVVAEVDEGAEEEATGPRAGEHAADVAEIAAPVSRAALDQPRGSRREQGLLPVEPSALHGLFAPPRASAAKSPRGVATLCNRPRARKGPIAFFAGSGG
ncbi:MAG: hypothetical protein KC420_01090 [Myxococcales bacterium]|nr:hypothetical protein [Myxococcales bacterium]